MEAVLEKLNLSPGELREKYKQRAQTGDVVFKIGLVEIKAHSEVLAAQSEMFAAQFSERWNTSTAEMKTINFPLEVSSADLITFIGLCYGQFSQALDEQNIRSILVMADGIASDTIIDQCVNYIKRNDLGRVCEYLSIATEHHLPKLRSHCLNTFVYEFESIFNQLAELRHCSNEMLFEILGLELQCDEMAVFEGCMKWAKHNSGNACDGAVLRDTLGQCLGRMRFTSFTVDQLVRVMKNYPNLITPKEFTNITIAINSQDSEKEEAELEPGQYAVKKITDKRIRNGKTQFKTVWCDSWEDESNLNKPAKLSRFKNRRGTNKANYIEAATTTATDEPQHEFGNEDDLLVGCPAEVEETTTATEIEVENEFEHDEFGASVVLDEEQNGEHSKDNEDGDDGIAIDEVVVALHFEPVYHAPDKTKKQKKSESNKLYHRATMDDPVKAAKRRADVRANVQYHRGKKRTQAPETPERIVERKRIDRERQRARRLAKKEAKQSAKNNNAQN